MKQPEPSFFELGKLPPQALDMEEAVLGAILLEKDCLDEIAEVLVPEAFYKDDHQKIYSSILDLNRADKPIDIITVTEDLRSKRQLEEVGGPMYITNLTMRVSSSSHAAYHARIIHQKFLRREQIRISSEAQKLAYDESIDIDETLDNVESQYSALRDTTTKQDAVRMSSILPAIVASIEEAQKSERKLIGVPSGFASLDRITGGWRNKNLIILAARPSMGKTAIGLEFAINAAEFKFPVGVFSLEMSKEELVYRTMSRRSGIPMQDIEMGKVSWPHIESAVADIEKMGVYIDDTGGMTIGQIRAKTKQMIKKNGIKLLVIDYLQRVHGTRKHSNRDAEIGEVSSELKTIAKRHNIPVIALAQLSRNVENRPGQSNDPRPRLSDLRESGNIEADADMVIFIHRPEYYGKTEDNNGRSVIGVGFMPIAKHRNGSLGEVNFYYSPDWTRISDSPISDWGTTRIDF